MPSLKRLARKTLRQAGLERIRTPSVVDFLVKERVGTVLDVGANVGQFGMQLREHGYKGRIISFEPVRSVFECLQRRTMSDPIWDTHHLALGSTEGEKKIHIAEQSVFSSFKKPSAYVNESFPGSQLARTESVQVARLDSFFNQHPETACDAFLKVDTQGFEEEVLRGAGAWLEKLTAIQLELPMHPLYEDQKTWLQIVNDLVDQGFSVAMVKENSYDWARMRLLELDIVFTRAHLDGEA